MLSVTISKTPTNKYYASITCEINNFQSKYKKHKNKSIGIDVGIKSLITYSDGLTEENIKPLKTALKKVKYNQRQLSKKEKGSKLREKQRIKLAKIHEKVTNIRKHYLHQITTNIIKNHNNIFVEDLNVKGILKNHKLAFSISDLGLGKFYKMLEYKSKWHNRNYIKVDRFYPSSKLCSHCNFKNNQLELKDRNWTCSNCNTEYDRDINAAKNILREGLRILNQNKVVKKKKVSSSSSSKRGKKTSGCEVQSDVKSKQVEAFSIEKSTKLENQHHSIKLNEKD